MYFYGVSVGPTLIGKKKNHKGEKHVSELVVVIRTGISSTQAMTS